MSTITSANAKLAFTIRNSSGAIIVGPFTVQGFATDDAFATEAVESAVAKMGVDGRMSAGFVPFLTPQTLMLQADSPSILLFDIWVSAQKALQDVLFADGALVIPGIQKAYTLVKGALTRHTPIPPGKRTLDSVSYEITWEDVQPAPITV